jgi:hypothetical protein
MVNSCGAMMKILLIPVMLTKEAHPTQYAFYINPDVIYSTRGTKEALRGMPRASA